MIIYTDSIDYSRLILGKRLNWVKMRPYSTPKPIRKLAEKLFQQDSIYECKLKPTNYWKYLFLKEFAPESQYDILIQGSQSKAELPDGILCLAGSGQQFHGFKNRSWVSLPGNIHLSVFFSPQQVVDHFSSGFLTLAAVSVIQTIDSIKGLAHKASVKWVNDIIIRNAKVCGVLAYTQTMGTIVTGAVLGIGLNITATPRVPPDIFAPAVGSLSDFVKNSNDYSQQLVFERLIRFLDQNYHLLIKGHYRQILDFYRQRSLVIGRKVQIYPDVSDYQPSAILRGKVTEINDNLELILDGVDHPITKGRLKLDV